MKKIMLFVLSLCLCFTAFGAAFAETAQAEAPAAEKPAAEMTAEELYQAGEDAKDAEDYAKALEYYSMAAEQGEPNAIFFVGDCYYLGQGVEKDLDKAAEWYRKALNAGFEPEEEDQARLKEVLGDEYQQK